MDCLCHFVAVTCHCLSLWIIVMHSALHTVTTQPNQNNKRNKRKKKSTCISEKAKVVLSTRTHSVQVCEKPFIMDTKILSTNGLETLSSSSDQGRISTFGHEANKLTKVEDCTRSTFAAWSRCQRSDRSSLVCSNLCCRRTRSRFSWRRRRIYFKIDEIVFASWRFYQGNSCCEWIEATHS